MMIRAQIMIVLLVSMMFVGSSSAGTWVFTGDAGCSNCEHEPCDIYGDTMDDLLLESGITYTISQSVWASFDNGGCVWCNQSCGYGQLGTSVRVGTVIGGTSICSNSRGGGATYSIEHTPSSSTYLAPSVECIAWGAWCCECDGAATVVVSNDTAYTVSGDTMCTDQTILYIFGGGSYHYVDNTTSQSYSFEIFDGVMYRLVFDGVYYDFTCAGNEVFDYDGCAFVYGYTCGIDSVRLYKDDGGWVIDEIEGQDVGYDIYEIEIDDGKDYLISFVAAGFVVCNQTFTCVGTDVHIDHDRCYWVYPPSPWDTPYIIQLWVGYDYNVVIFRDVHGNAIENSQLAIYDQTDNEFIQKWTDTLDGYALLGARFDTDHDVQLLLRTFDGVFTLDTTYPANGSAPVGEEDITTTNWTIPIKYNLDVHPIDQYGVPVFDVFCGLYEYTPINPGAFWGMDLSDRGYIAVTNCSGFSMCDMVAEKDGYTDYKADALEWASKSAIIKDYRHEIVMEEE